MMKVSHNPLGRFTVTSLRNRHAKLVALCATACLFSLTGGAAYSEEDKPAAAAPSGPPDPAVYGIELTADDASHWAFQPITRPRVPLDAHPGGENAIDAFIGAKLREKGLDFSPPADRASWLRRVWFDLVGLPAPADEIERFVADRSPDAREKAVDRALADPGYGIRWGRRWLDVVRYADTNGYERDGNKPNAWRYRDYVIDSYNADKPFDRFLTEHLAGDELPDSDAQTMIALTWLRLGTWDDEPADPEVDRYDQLDDVLGTVTATFLGVTLRCARCHNHKFDPFSQIDYSKMLAIFEPLERPQEGRIEHDVAVGTRRELADFQAAVARHEGALAALTAQAKALDEGVRVRYFESNSSTLAPEALAAHKAPADKRTEEQKQLVKETQKKFDEELSAAHTPDETRQRGAFQAALSTLREAAPASLPRAYIWRETGRSARSTRVFRRGNPTHPAGEVGPGFPAVLPAGATELFASPPHSPTSGRRTGLARWLTSPENPLAARVLVNRVWQGHFGDGLVSTENDFGRMGDLPSHPELLDWLALTLRDNGWRLKPLHRLIVLSRTYGQSSAFREEGGRVDADNEFLWRFPYRRLEAEALRDSVLQVSGQLNPRMGGPGVYPKIAREVLEGQSRPGEGWGDFDSSAATCRSVYIFVKRSLIVPEMELLDFADTNTSCEQRPVSTIPTQALTLLNGEFFNSQAHAFAQRLEREAGAERQRAVALAWRLALGRNPSAEESAEALAFLDRQGQLAANENAAGLAQHDLARSALAALCLTLFNLNEFAYID